MMVLLEFIGVLTIAGAFAYWQTPRLVWTSGIALLLLAASIWSHLPWWVMTILWLIYLPAAIIFNVTSLRQTLISLPILHYLQRTMPPMGETEQIALDAGDVWLDADIFQGNLKWQALFDEPLATLTDEEKAFINNQVKELCRLSDDWETLNVRGDLSPQAWDYIKKEKFFGLIIPKEYGGLGFSALAHSTIISMLGSRSSTAAVDVMVPNSLGPAELLMEYGTDDQKDYYLPRLASGEEIPCFGLTSPEAGSDASSMPDLGVVCKRQVDGKEVIGISVNFDKHYITLAPVATLVGVAFYLRDPQQLLSTNEDIGITLALIPANTPGLEIGNRHSPLNLAFMNGPVRGKDVFISMDTIIGGEKNLGQGWRMLMEALSAGRGISLPSLATAGAKLVYRMTGAYARIRSQFRTSIGNFEGVQEALAPIAAYTYLMESTRLLTATAIDNGIRPSLVSGIAKYHLTEMGRKIINHSMDIHGGRGIQGGPRNYLASHYQSMPVAITVEGANILTRCLIIFGQGAMRCHPFLREELATLEIQEREARQNAFDKTLTSHIGYSIGNFVRTLFHGLTGGRFVRVPEMGIARPYAQQLQRMSASLAFSADVVMLFMGGALKRKESISARLGDVLSQIYLATAAIKYYQQHGYQVSDEATLHWALQHCLAEIQHAYQGLFRNFPQRVIAKLLKFIIFPWGMRYQRPSDQLNHDVAKQMQYPSVFRDRLSQYCYLGENEQDAVGRMEATFEKYHLAEPCLKIYYKALRDETIDHFSAAATQIATLQQKKLLTAEEAKVLADFLEARRDAVRVDEFEPDKAVVSREKLLRTGND